MFFYLYDAFVSDKKYQDELTKAENRLIELGINGRIEKLSILRNPKELIIDAIKKDAHTIVAVGNDSTLIKVMNIVADYNIAIGYIPLQPNSPLAKIFGIPDSFIACNILSKRLIKKISLGKANQNYFVGSLNISDTDGVAIECDDKYKITLKEKNCYLAIYNLGNILEKREEKDWQIFPQKNFLNVVACAPLENKILNFFKKKNSDKTSIFQVKKIKITTSNKVVPVMLDGQITLKTPLTVVIKPKKINIIVGKERKI